MEGLFDLYEDLSLDSENDFINSETSFQKNISNEQPSTSGTSSQSSAAGVQPNGMLKDPPDIREILSTDEALITPTSHNVGVINAACQKVLKYMEQQLVSMLKKNKQEQEDILNFLSSNNKHVKTDETVKPHIKCAGIPYFKDLQGYPPPVNKDVLRKKRNNKLLPAEFIDTSPVWNSTDAKNLIKAVNKVLVKMPSDQPIDPDSIDWLRISATDLDGKFSPSECKSKWILNLAPHVNRSRWKMKELKLLEEIAEKHDCQDWDKIAEELNTGRTGFQCCVQYRTYNGTNRGKWTKEEDETLKNIIKQYKVRDIIPWKKVAWYFEHRSLRQCNERYTYHLGGIKKGNFSTEEDFVIAYLATKLKNFGEVAKYIPGRVANQVRSRYEYLVNITMPKFTKEEDDLLTFLMTQHPRNWSKISESFQNRSKLQCRRRWAAIQNNIKLEKDELADSENEIQPYNSTEDRNTVPQDEVDSQNVTKNLKIVAKYESSKKKQPKQYVDLINYHKNCYKFLFGPKTGVPAVKEEFEWLVKKASLIMQNLSTSSSVPASPTFDITSLVHNCEFDDQDIAILTEIKRSDVSETRLQGKMIPPNYTTLVGIRTLLLGWNRIRNLSCSYNFNSENTVRSCKDRVLCSDAKKLFKARMRALFVFPIILSNISQENIESDIKARPKARKQTKPLSKRKRKQHAKLMSSIYRNKLPQENEETLSNGAEENEDKSESEYVVKEKRKRTLQSTGSVSEEAIEVKRSKKS